MYVSYLCYPNLILPFHDLVTWHKLDLGRKLLRYEICKRHMFGFFTSKMFQYLSLVDRNYSID